MFETLTDRLDLVFKNLRRKAKLSEADVDATMREVRLALLEADVNFDVVKGFIERLRERAVGQEVSRALNPAQQIIKIVHEELIVTLGEPAGLKLSAIFLPASMAPAGKPPASAFARVMMSGSTPKCS